MMEAVSTYEISIYFYESTVRKIPEGSHVQEIPYSNTHIYKQTQCLTLRQDTQTNENVANEISRLFKTVLEYAR
jgi:hypothetical protein